MPLSCCGCRSSAVACNRRRHNPRRRTWSIPPARTTRPSAHALQFTSAKLLAKVHNGSLAFHWIGSGERFWYRKSLGPAQVEFMAVEASTGKQAPLFDSTASPRLLRRRDRTRSAVSTIRNLAVGNDGHSVIVSMRKNGAKCRWPRALSCSVDEAHYSCDLPVSSCKLLPDAGKDGEILPGRHNAAFARDHNLWIRNTDSGAERQLTQAGVDSFAYGELLGQYSTDEIPRRRARVAASPRGHRVVAGRKIHSCVTPRPESHSSASSRQRSTFPRKAVRRLCT